MAYGGLTSIELDKDHDKEVEFKKNIERIFGKSIADAILPKNRIIQRKKIQILGDRFIHPTERPIFVLIANRDLTTENWALLLYFVLSCKYLERHKVGFVYNNVFEILTGIGIDAKTKS